MFDTLIVYVFRCPEHMGKLKRLKLWHNNKGASPDWYIKRVIVQDKHKGKTLYVKYFLLKGNYSFPSLYSILSLKFQTTTNLVGQENAHKPAVYANYFCSNNERMRKVLRLKD